MQIAGYLKTSLIEWSGKICSVVFTPGCNFRCPFCHNADLVGNRRLALTPERQIFADLKERKKWVDAVVITGGEPTLQKDLAEFLEKLGKLGFLRMIQTNGTKPEVLEKLLATRSPDVKSGRSVDYVCMDLKGDLENYQRFAGVKTDIEKIKKSLKLIAESGVEHELRTTVVPGLHDLKNLRKLAEEIRSTVYGLQSTVDDSQKTVDSPKWYLQQFRPMNTLNKKYLKIKPYSGEEMESFQKELRKIIPNVFLRGI